MSSPTDENQSVQTTAPSSLTRLEIIWPNLITCYCQTPGSNQTYQSKINSEYLVFLVIGWLFGQSVLRRGFSKDISRIFPGHSQDFPKNLLGITKDFLRAFQYFLRTFSGHLVSGTDCKIVNCYVICGTINSLFFF